MSGDLHNWLKRNDLLEFEELLSENEVDLRTLEILTDADLRELGLAFGPRKRFLSAIAGLKSGPEKAAASPRSRQASQAPGERRHLTVMFCDLAESTAMAERLDPEELHLLIKTFYKTITDEVLRYNGYVANYLGDGMLIYFGWPIAHEDAAENGVRAALEMVRAVKSIRAAKPLVVRVGLATGAVVVGEASREGKVETGLVVGEIPNLAARLQSLAGPDEVVIARSTRSLLGDAFSLTALGEHTLKGIAKPVEVWRVDAARRMEGRFRAAHSGESDLAPLVGRDEETTLLARRWQQARSGEGQVVLIGGEPGIGKSRLTQGLREGIAEHHVAMHFQCSPVHLNSPLHPFIEQFEIAAGFAPDDPPERRLEKMEAALAGGEATVAEVAPLFAALHSLPGERYPPLELSPQKQKENTLDALIGQIEAKASMSPVLVVFEDAHWVDPTSQELLDLLVPKVRGLPVIFVITHRLDYRPPWAGRAGVTTVLLNRLGWQEGARIVETVTEGRSLPMEVLDEILSRTDGVPLFVEELTRSVIDSGQLRERDGRYELEGSVANLTIPASLRDLLAARLDRLGQAKGVAQLGACIGREFSRDLLGRISKRDEEALEAALEALVEAELVTRDESSPEVVYRFRHALIQDAAYDSLLKSTRRELHARIAQVLERDAAERGTTTPEWLAYHHTQAGHLERAIPLWREAGSLAVSRVALKEAVAHFQKGLALIDELPRSKQRDGMELTIREPLNAAFTGLRGWAAPEVGENAAAILELSGRQRNAQSLTLAIWWVWTSTITQGRIADSLPWVERLIAEGGGEGDSDLRIFGHATAMVQHFLSGELAESREQTERALSLWNPQRAERWMELTSFDMRTFVEVYACQAIWVMGYPDQAVKLSDDCVAYARSSGHAFNLVWALIFSSYVFAYRREPERCLERIEEADRLAREQGLAFIYEVSVPQARGMAELYNQRPQAAIPLLQRGIERWTQTGGNVRVPLLKSALAEAVMHDGDLDGAMRLIEECRGQIEEPSGQERLWLPEVLRRKAEIVWRYGNTGEAEHLLRSATDLAREQGARGWELRSATALARLLAESGRGEEAKGLLAPVFETFTEGLDTADLREAREVVDRL